MTQDDKKAESDFLEWHERSPEAMRLVYDEVSLYLAKCKI